MAEPGSPARAFDEPWYIRDGRPALVRLAEVEHAEVGLQSGEWVVGDLRRRRGQRREERRLARIGESHEADVGNQPELQPERPLLARFTFLGMLGGLVRGGLEVRIPQAAA